jgi:hypothetical protein
MKKERINLSYNELTKNAGQIAWLPSNPRTWTADDVRRTEASVQEDPDFLEDARCWSSWTCRAITSSSPGTSAARP